MSSEEKGEDAASRSFTLMSNPLFSTRSNDIFASLDVLEQKHSVFQKTQATSESLEHAGVIKSDPVLEDETSFQQRKGDKSYDNNSTFRQRGGQNRPQNHDSRLTAVSTRNPRDDGFRRPRPYRARRVPDFKKNPERYTCYSLEDVSESDMSDKSNKRAALDFLFERKNERERNERLAAGLSAEEEKFESDTAACSKGLISFSKSKMKRDHKKMDTEEKSHVTSFHDRFEDSVIDDDDDDDKFGDEKIVSRVGSSKLTKTADVKLDKNYCGEDCGSQPIQDGESNKPLFKFKSRKNVKKHIRMRDDSDD